MDLVSDPVARVEHMRRYIKCALQHPVLPSGSHNQVPVDSVEPALRAYYQAVYELYTTVPDSEVFREPVNALETDALDYYQRIDKPMSLREVLDRIVEKSYTTANQAASDVALVWQNCDRYNGPGSPFVAAAKRCEAWLADKLKAYEAAQPAPLPRVERLLGRVEQLGSDELLEDVRDLVQKNDPSLLVDDEVEFDRMTTGLLIKLERLVDSHARPGSASGRGGRGSPAP